MRSVSRRVRANSPFREKKTEGTERKSFLK